MEDAVNINDLYPTGVPPECPKDSNTRDQMQKIARLVEDEIPDGWGFFVMVYPHEDNPGRMNYASKSRRDDVIKLMEEFIAKSKANPCAGHV